MREYFLLPHIYSCLTDDGIVLLDLKNDSYHGIGRNELRMLQFVVLGWNYGDSSGAEDTSLITERYIAKVTSIAEALVARNFLTRDRLLGKSASPVNIYSRNAISFCEITGSQPRILHAAHLLMAWLIASAKLRFWSLEEIVENVKSKKARFTQATQEDMKARTLAAIFCYLRPLLFTARDACLFDSLVLVEFLASFNIYPSWVFGVKTQPFYAHSWVQYNDIVLNDTVEHTRAFTPILAI